MPKWLWYWVAALWLDDQIFVLIIVQQVYLMKWPVGVEITCYLWLCFTAVWAELEPQRRTLRMTCAWCSLPSGLCQTESCDVLPWGQLGQILFLLGFTACYQDPLRAHKCVSKSSRLSTLQTQLRKSIVFLPSVQWLDEQPVWRRWSRLRRWPHSVVHKWCGIIQDPLGLKNKW